MTVEQAVIPAAGLGTRLLPATKEQPKEMLPIYARDSTGKVCLKPVLQLIFEGLYSAGLREFCFIIGRGKRAIEDHFTQDYSFMSYLRKKGIVSADELELFYQQLDDSVISWITQPEPRGFGEAVLRAQSKVGDEDFVVHAGDACIVSEKPTYFERLTKIFETHHQSAVLLIHEIPDPRTKGVAEVRRLEQGRYEVLSVTEKPENPKSNFAIEPVYIFQPDFFDSLLEVPPDRTGEIQLTDGIQRIISQGQKVRATALLEQEVRLDVGDPESYWEALALSYKIAKR